MIFSKCQMCLHDEPVQRIMNNFTRRRVVLSRSSVGVDMV